VNKRFIGASELLLDSFRLARRVLDSGFRPELLAGVWRGGTPVAIAVQEYLAFNGVHCEHVPVKTAFYTAPDRRERQVRVDGIETLIGRLGRGTPLLLVDDVFDTGLSMKELLRVLRDAAPPGSLGPVRVACPWFKPARNASGFLPDYFLHETDEWLVFPHELLGLHRDELRNKPDLARLFEEFFRD
jgi:hypoxanthine phosphoribosyltransferase